MTTLPATLPERITLPPRGGTLGGGPSFRDLLAILRRRLVMIVVLFLIFGAAAAGGFYVWWRYFPSYRAEGLIECVTSIPREALSVSDARLADREHERFVLTQSYMVKNPEVLRAALQSSVVQGTRWYAGVAPEKREITLFDDLVSAPVRGTNYLRVAIDTRSANDPHVIVNEVIQRYLDKVKDRSTEAYRDDLKSGRDELEAHRAALAAKREQLKAAAERLPSGLVSGHAGAAARDGVLYSQQVADLRLQLSQLEQLRAYYQQGGAVTAEDAAAVEADPYVQTLATQLFQLEQQRALSAKRYGSRHDVIRRLDAAIDTAREALRQTREQKTNEYRQAIQANVESTYQNMQYALFTAMDSLRVADAAQKDYDRAFNDYSALTEEVSAMEQKEIELDNYVSNLERLVKNKSGITVNYAQVPVPPLLKSSPNLAMLPVMIFLALVMSVGVAVGLDAMNTSLRTTQDIARHLDVALLGVVPDLDDEEVNIEHVELAVTEAPRSMVAEAFRQVRANLQFSAPASRQRTVAVTSPGPGDGKTTVACNLAVVLAQGGRRVLLVDANLRRPTIHRHLAVEGSSGLSNILVGQKSLDQCVARTAIPRLDVLPSGPLPPNPAELLSGEPFDRMLTEASQQYDQIIIDTPPVLLTSDAVEVGSHVDGVVVVVRANANTRGAARRACAMLTSVGAHLFGAVLNAARVTRGGYFREQLRSYYDYQPETVPSAPPPELPRDEGT